MPLLETPGQSQTSLGQSLLGSLLIISWVLVHIRFCLCPPRFCPQSCVSSGSSMVGLMATSSKRAYAIPRSIAPRAPAPASIGDTQTQFWLSLCGIPGSWCAQGLFEPSECLWCVWGLILNVILPLLPSCWGFSFALQCGYLLLVGSNILLSMVVQQRVVILEFSQEKMGTHPSTPPSCVFFCKSFRRISVLLSSSLNI